MEEYVKATASCGVTVEQAADAAARFARIAADCMSKEEMMANIKLNPTLSYFEKRKLIKMLNKT